MAPKIDPWTLCFALGARFPARSTPRRVQERSWEPPGGEKKPLDAPKGVPNEVPRPARRIFERPGLLQDPPGDTLFAPRAFQGRQDGAQGLPRHIVCGARHCRGRKPDELGPDRVSYSVESSLKKSDELAAPMQFNEFQRNWNFSKRRFLS